MNTKNYRSSGKARVLLNLLSDPSVIVDEKGNFSTVNDEFEEITGLSRKELIGNPFFKLNLLTPESKAVLLENLKKRMQGAPVKPYEVCFTDKAGETRFVEVKGKKVSYAGQPANLVVFHDVTLRKENARRLKEYSERMETLVEEKVKEIQNSEEKFRNLAEHSPNMIFICQKGKVVYVNKEAEKAMGYTKEEFYSSEFSFLDLITPENREFVLSIFAKHAKGEDVEPYEYGLMAKDGGRIDAMLNSKLIDFNGEPAILGIVTDITERKRMDLKLRDAEQRYHALFDQAPLGVLVIDSQTAKPVEFNDVACTQLGYSREEFSKLCISDFEVKGAADEVTKHISRIVSKGVDEFETKHRTKDGEIRDVLVTTRAVELGGKTFLYCIFHDITDIRKVQDALMKSETQYRQLVELAQEGIWALNNDFTTVFVNPRMAQMLGYTESEMIGKSLFEFLDRGVIEQVKHFLTQSKHSLKGQFVGAFPRKDGTHIDTSIAASTITDDQGQPIGTLALVADITEHKQLEDALRASEERFRAISTSAMDAIILVDEEDKVIYWNPAAEKTFGFAEKEAVNKKMAELVIPLHGRKNHAALLEELKHNSFSKEYFEFTALRKDGTEFPMDLSVAAVKLKDKNCLLSIVRDVSERKAMEEALRQERDMLESITKNIGAGLVFISKDYKILWLNNYLKQFTGASENNPCYSSFNTCTTICPDCGPKKIFEGAPFDTREYCNKTEYNKDHPVWFELIATPIKDKDGNVVAALELTVNITEKKNLEAKLAEYSQKLEKLVEERTEQLQQAQAKLVKSERLAAIGELAGMIGHDLRNPLTGIKNSVYYLKKKGTAISESHAKEMLETIDKCVDYSNKIVNDLLDYSREIHLELQETSPRSLLSEALDMVQVPEKVVILNHLPDEQRLMVDPDKIERVFINLVKNAIDAMPNGGKITVGSKEVDGSLEISFADTGMGISDEVLPKMFSPLFTTKAQGMGFGLAICKRIIEAHEGAISVKTVAGKGTVFTVTLPIKREPEIGGEKVWINMPESSLSTMTKT